MQDLAKMYYDKTETITERMAIWESYNPDFIKKNSREISEKYEVEFRPAREGERYIKNFAPVSTRVATFNHKDPSLVVIREIVNQIQEVYKTQTLNIPEGYKVIAFREPRDGDTYINVFNKEVRGHSGSFFVSTIHPTNRVILEESYTEEIVPDRVDIPKVNERYWSDLKQEWRTADNPWAGFRRVIGKVVKKPCPASVFTQGDLDKLVK